jgi:serine O-acetyltransferase
MTLTTSRNPYSIPHPKRGPEAIYYISHLLSKTYLGSFFSAFLKRVNQLIFHVNIPPQVKIGKRLELAHGGFGVVIQQDTIIGDDAIIFHNVTIGNGGARIGDRVYIGTGVVIIGAVKIGDDVSIGANTVVNFDVPPGATVVGTRAKIITVEEKKIKATTSSNNILIKGT